ncbi:MAG TPA: Ig-like domain repeat protein [Tepidisphaeraceae bacterium]
MKKLNRSSRKVVSSAVAPIHRRRRARLWSALPEVLEGRLLMSTYQVTTTADSGAGSLRQAILNVDGDSSADTITFNLSGSGVQTILLDSALPQITSAVTIDATGQQVELNGAGAGAGANGLDFETGSAGSVVTGLTINSFSGAGVLLNSGNVTLANNYVGTDVTGTTGMANHDGVVITSDGNTLSGNLISGNNYDGVYVKGAHNTLTGNLIGLDATGENAVPNSVLGANVVSGGVVVDSSAYTTIGGATASDRNVITGNNQDGIVFINDSGPGNVVDGNYIGLDMTGTLAVTFTLDNNFYSGNNGAGVDLGSASGLAVSNVQVFNNIISANQYSGVYLSAATDNTIQGNIIGLGEDGVEQTDPNTMPLGNQADGITIDQGSGGNLIGGAGAGNVIAGSAGTAGITIQSGPGLAANVVQGNYIGTDATGKVVDGNNNGIWNVSGPAIIGGAAQGDGNVIAGNFGYGVYLAAGGTQVLGNLIGVGADGTTNLGNAQDGVYIVSSGNIVGTDVNGAGAGNVIDDNGVGGHGAGVTVYSGTGNTIRGNSIFGNRKLGIDLGGSGVPLTSSQLNKPGPNNFLGYPVLSANTDGIHGQVTATITGAIGAQYTVDFYTNSNQDSSGYGQGQTFVGSQVVTIGSDGTAMATLATSQPAGTIWSATVTDDASGNTSEFAKDATEVHVMSSTTTVVTSPPSVFGDTVTFTATVSGGGPTPTGSVQFSVDGTPVGGPVTLVNGVATYSTNSLSVADHTVAAAYTGDANYFPSSGSHDQVVNPAPSTTSLTASTASSTLGQTITLTATVGPNINGVLPTGTLTFSNGGTVLGTGTLANGVATLTVSSLGVGSDSLVAQYGGDGNFAPSSGSTTEVVSQAASSTSLSVSPASSTFGQTVTLAATVTPSISGYVLTGSVNFMDGSTSLGTVTVDADGTASLQISTLALGGHTITAVYSGDTNFTGSTSNPVTETVNPAPSTISGRVANDLTGNGFSSDDTGLGGWTVNLFLNGATTPVATTVSAADGSYSFANLAPGSYSVQEVLPAGWTETGGNGGYQVTAVNANAFSGVDFDNFQDVSVSGTVYQDLTGIGFSADDKPMSGVTVNLFVDGGATPVATFTSASDGTYSFVNLGPGSYSVQEVVPAGYSQTGGVGGYALAAVSGQNASGDNFDNYLTPVPPPPPAGGAISGYVFCDDNLNGVFDATSQDGVVSPESGEAGATVTLTGTTAMGASVSMQAYTDANGHYSFSGLSAGTYTVSLTGYSQDHQAEQSHGNVHIKESTTVSLTAGQTLAGAAEGAATMNNGLDFAEIAPGALQGFVSDDTNNDGNIDFNEAGIVNVTIQLNGVTYTGAKVSQTAVTDNNGEYIFTNLQPGTYTLTEVTPGGFTDGKDTVGSLGGSETYSSNCGSSSGCSTGQTNCGAGSYSSGSSNYNDCYGNYGYNCFTGYSNNCYSNCYTNCGGSSNCGNCGGNSNNCNSQSNCGWSSGCNSAQNTFSSVQIGGCEDVGLGYNFGEHSQSLGSGSSCHSTDTASLAFWHNSHGQALLCSLNGGPNSTALGNWLATMFPNLYGAGAKVNFAKMTNTQIAAFYNANDFNVSGIKLDAAVLSAALSSYVTNSTWSGGNYATKYGFTVSAKGVGYDTLTVGSNGAAFGVSNNSTITILQALDATNQLSNGDNGQLYGGNTTLRAEAYNIYAAIAQNGLTS